MVDFLSAHILMILSIVGILFYFYWLYRHRDILRAPWWALLGLAILHMILGILSVKVFAVLETLDLSKAGAMSLFGAVFFMPLAYYLGAKLSKRDVAQVFDIFTPCIVFALLCARTNCIFSGCCLGKFIPGMDGARWPTRELEILFYIILLVWLWRTDRKEETPGLKYPVYMIAYGAFRFVTEWFRVSDSPAVIHISHLWAAVCFCLGLSIYSELKRKKTRRKKHA